MSPLCSDFLLEADRFAQFAHTARLSLTVARAELCVELDRALRAFGGAPTYALTDNERTVSTDHIAGIAVRNPQIVSVARHYGLVGRDVRARRSAEQGRLGGDGPDRPRRSGGDRSQLARRL